jgi:hypothetical protein
MMLPLQEGAMARGRRRKCKCCRRLFLPDPRNLRHQRYCSQPLCRAASKAASQARWLAQPENHDYFRGPVHLARSQAWRAGHPGYSRKASRPRIALKEVSTAQEIGFIGRISNFVRSPPQDLLTAQPTVLIGLIAHLAGTPLQDDIVRAIDRLLRLGQDILAAPEVRSARAVARPNRSEPMK